MGQTLSGLNTVVPEVAYGGGVLWGAKISCSPLDSA